MEKHQYYCVQLTREELNEISIALKNRIDYLKKALEEVHSIEAKEVIGEALKTCISAQQETTYAGQPAKYRYQ